MAEDDRYGALLRPEILPTGQEMPAARCVFRADSGLVNRQNETRQSFVLCRGPGELAADNAKNHRAKTCGLSISFCSDKIVALQPLPGIR